MAKALPPRGFEGKDTEKRLQWLEDKTGVRLDGVGSDQPPDFRGIIENHVGSVSVPMAVAGPLVLNGSYAQGEYYVPLCTLEATLSKSMSRGLYLTSLSGGIKTHHLKQESDRGWVESKTLSHRSGGGRMPGKVGHNPLDMAAVNRVYKGGER